MAHLGARLLLTRSLAAVGVVRHHDLVDQGLVVRAPEERFGSIDGLQRLALVVDDLEFHHLAPFVAGLGALAFTLGRTITEPFLAPGTEPLIMRRERSASTRATSSSCTVRFTSP